MIKYFEMDIYRNGIYAFFGGLKGEERPAQESDKAQWTSVLGVEKGRGGVIASTSADKGLARRCLEGHRGEFEVRG